MRSYTGPAHEPVMPLRLHLVIKQCVVLWFGSEHPIKMCEKHSQLDITNNIAKRRWLAF